MRQNYLPIRSLRGGHWFKLICGASFQDLPSIRSLSLVYTLAGADCIDVAANPAVIGAAAEGIEAALQLFNGTSLNRILVNQSPILCELLPLPPVSRPWLMVSVNDGEDPHFRKAQFEPQNCPPDCSRPCERVCPAQAIAFPPASSSSEVHAGVIEDRCYGCGRCLPVCPLQHIETRSITTSPEAIAPWLEQGQIDAIEIHTQVERLSEFRRVWQAIAPWSQSLKALSISCPAGEGLVSYLKAIAALLTPFPGAVIWQADGRPMSGDIGDGTTHATLRLGQQVLAAQLPGFVQLAGGTNRYTVPKLQTLGLLNPHRLETPDLSSLALNLPSSNPDSLDPRTYIAGVAYGSYARTLLAPVLDTLDQRIGDRPSSEHFSQDKESAARDPHRGKLLEQEFPKHARSSPTIDKLARVSELPPRWQHLESHPDLLWQAVEIAYGIVSQLKAKDENSRQEIHRNALNPKL